MSGPDPLDAIRQGALEGDAGSASRSLLRSVGPRLLRDILGPTLLFYVPWKLTGNVFLGIALGSAFAIGAWQYERRQGRPGLVARLVLAFVLVQAVVGIATGSAEAYLVQPALLGAINGAVWLGSVAIGKPLAGVFAHEVFPVDAELRATPEFRDTFRRVSLLFGVFFLAFAVVQVVVLLIFGVDAFVAVRIVDVVCTLALVVYCLRFMVRRVGPLLRRVTPAP